MVIGRHTYVAVLNLEFRCAKPEGCPIESEQTRLKAELEDWKARNRTLMEEIRQIEEQCLSDRKNAPEKEAASLLLVCQDECAKKLYALLKQLREEDMLHEQLLLEKYKKLESLKSVLEEALNLIRKAMAEY